MDTGRPKVHPLMRLLDGFLRQTQTDAGIPFEPEEDPGVSITFMLEVQIVSKKQRVDITFEVVKIGWHEMYQEEEVEQIYRDLIATIGPELMHNSESWGCFGCGRESLQALQNHRCKKCAPKMERGTLKFVQKENQRRSEGDSKSSTVMGTIQRPEGMSGGLSGACLTCRKEATEAPEFNMSRCAKCKLVRMRRFIDGSASSVACQKQDWERHKPNWYTDLPQNSKCLSVWRREGVKREALRFFERCFRSAQRYSRTGK
ncbi:hypothetical protein FB451DRAFT_1184389 [Mycena latifolia]|nr:hypothetical protein FB451DRAFT_1184389 [Mycena latifolia]